MNILLGLAPFIVFFVLMRLVSPLAGLAAAFAVAVLFALQQWGRGEQIKILEIGTLLLFGVLVLFTLIAVPHWSVATVRLVVDGGLFAIALTSLLIGMPFTLQYARQQVPRQYWDSPLFLITNRRITGAWTTAFAVMASADAAAEYVEAIPLWIDIAATIAAFVAALWFTQWYPAVVRRRVESAAASRG